MPDLPTLTVTQAQADRMLAAFGSVAEYRAWLKQQIIEFVVAKERTNAINTFQNEQKNREAQTRQDLA